MNIENIKSFLNNFRHDKKGVVAIEYGIIGALSAVGIISGLSAINAKMTALFNGVLSTLP